MKKSGNMYTITTLTSRELGSIIGYANQIDTIVERRKNGNNEDQDIIAHLRRAQANLLEAIWKVEAIRKVKE